MNGLNYDPGLRQAFSQQTRQRLLSEANNARFSRSLNPAENDRKETRRYNLALKIKVVSEIIKESGSAILMILRANRDSLNA